MPVFRKIMLQNRSHDPEKWTAVFRKIMLNDSSRQAAPARPICTIGGLALSASTWKPATRL
jgi:hypothetical protein